MIRWITRIALAAALACALAALAAGPGYRFGAWPLAVGFTILSWASYVAAAVALISLVAAIASRRAPARPGFATAIAALVVSVATFAGPALMLARAKSVPPIHDITTDTDDPPRFVAALPARASASNSPEYGGPDVAAQQRSGYPSIAPLVSAEPADEAFRRALKVARDMGWTIVAAVPADGRIEATDTTMFFGFKDDIVIRVRPASAGSRVDIRSESRIGKSDIGTNARRIEAFLKKMRGGS